MENHHRYGDEGLPSIEVSDEPAPTRDHSSIRIPYSSEGAVLESFDKDDEVRLVRKMTTRPPILATSMFVRARGKKLLLRIRPGSGP